MRLIYFLAALIILTSLLLTTTSAAGATLPGCPDSCGNLTIPYPFGTQSGCHLPGFLITCNTTYSPPRAFINIGNVRVNSIDLSAGSAVVELLVARDCYAPLQLSTNIPQTWADFTGLPYAFSNTRNKFTALGCSAIALNYRFGQTNSLSYTSGCIAFCSELSSVINGSCSGIGCCQTAIPRGLQRVNTILQSTSNMNLTWTFSPCSLAFLIDTDEYVFDVADLADFYKRTTVPVVLDWAVGNNQTCLSAATSPDYACGDNSYCSNSTNAAGYSCSCQTGFQGNPYLSNGCQDINECEDPETSPCTNICENTIGSYACSCPHGYSGDGKKSGKGCNKTTTKFPLVQTVAGGGLGFLFLLLGGFSLYWFLKKRRMLRLREKFFNQNGGSLLKQQLAAREGLAETARVFTAAELKRATDNYSDSRILGHGGNGTVFKGILPDTNRVVAIKKSNLVDGAAAQVEEFINEVVLLSQVIHKHVVRILGCCLETPVPLLVYEYVPNGTLHHHLHRRPGSLSWEARLRIAVETAAALAYLHSAIARPIFHRDVKATNILLDEQYMAKVADFGASRLIPMDRAYITTLVQGTLGYLDPEYFLSGQLTEKSDVYSFGVVLAEMLTGLTPLSGERPPEEKNLAIFFLLKMKDGKLQEILEPRVRTEGGRLQVEAVADLARRCMRLKGEERPSMREVVAEIERARRPPAAMLDPWEGRGEVEDEESENFEDSETRFLSSRMTRVLSEEGTTAYFAASATGDESLDQHIMLSLEMQR
ncbi:Wall-associated receptor kinase 2 [Platanthera zijinensis]|uniref:Wall-associated receptor kinase 2 n=1 Tax=Platanthera zijinensis TaxID=2320716 RepID=A0AAP0AXM8_9ASPA